jgi:hypothetical protein
MKNMTIVAIHGIQLKYFIKFNFPPLTFFLFTAKQASCSPPQGASHPQKPLPKKIPDRNKIKNQ